MFTPYFNLDTTLTISGASVAAFGDGNGFVYTVDASTVHKIDINNNFVTSFTVTPTTSLIGTMTLLNASSGIMASTTSNQVELFEFSSGYHLTYALANTTCYTSAKGQQAAAVNGTALITNATSGKITKFVGSTFTSSVLAPAWLTTNLTTVIPKPNTGTFIVGSATGVVGEIDASGNLLSSITLPTTPNDGTKPVHIVAGLAYYSDILVVSVQSGFNFTYQWSTKTLIDESFTYVNTSSAGVGGWSTSGGGGGLTLCDTPSGVMMVGPAVDNVTGSYQQIFLGSISASGFTYEDTYVTSSLSGKIIATGVDHSVNKGWALYRSNSAGNFQIMTIPDAGLAGVDFRTQFPLGTDVTYRNIIVKDNGPGRTQTIVDEYEPTGITTKQLRKNARYIGISINGTNVDFRGIDT